MRAIICDACGEIYRPYDEIEGYGEGNMLTIVKTERGGKLNGIMRLELCPECMVKTHNFIANELVKPSSPAESKYFSGSEENNKTKSETSEEDPVSSLPDYACD